MNNNIEMIKQTAANAEEMARNIWLAGIGAYGKGVEEVKGRFDALSTDSNKLFAELVAKGEVIEAQGKAKVAEVKSSVTAKADLEARVETVRTKLGLNKTDADVKIEELNAKIDALTAAVAKLNAKPATKTAAKSA
ncbi:phasin family protein [Alteromonas flava]|uniref:phasin family protein n=1 Tax=Alteromonas flava TaxID=2048003 RepID=UPI000C28C705|nr:phasin family protein [Alteromonas flava]